MSRIGLISDTHGLLRPEAESFLAGCDHIIHGGDIGGPDILERLAEIANLTAVRGNNDKGDWARSLAETRMLHFGNVGIHVIHDLARMDIEPKSAGAAVVISGHSHRPRIIEKDGVLYVNPGSAGRRRFTLPISIGELLIDGKSIVARLAKLSAVGGGNPAAFVRDA
jgi:putative phosphoesterase